MNETRAERDTMGEMRVPAEALYGAQTARAIENFPISNLRIPPAFLRALARIKEAAAEVNGLDAVARAAHEVAEGAHSGHFPVDVFQTGSGTSTNMNVNEVIARLAGAHPNDDVNRGQSSNDAIPSALHIAAAEGVAQNLLPAMHGLRQSLERKAADFRDILKIGRTHWQDAAPVRLGQEFGGWAKQVELAASRVEAAMPGIHELPLGGTAVGTGLNAPSGFAAAVIAKLAERYGLPFVEAANHFEAQGARDAACHLSGALRTYSVALTKIASDIRFLASGPRCGIGELKLPAVQPGSSIMPGKVNPVIAESLLMACAQVIGNDAAIVWCCAGGNLELNVMMPLMAYDLLQSIDLLAAVSRNFATRLVDGIEPDRARAEGFVEQSLAMATALVPEIGYDRAAALVKDAWASGRTVRDVARDRAGIPESRLNELLDPARQA
jgi:fumarate hydratase class II